MLYGTVFEKPPVKKVRGKVVNPYNNKVVGKILRAVARWYERNRDGWTQGAPKRIVAGKHCYCLEARVAAQAMLMGLPNDRNNSPWFPDTRLREKLELNGIGNKFNDRGAQSVDDVISKCREVARRLR